ncbi:MAG: prepilin-type N-terminal cleavage/methylation domain-containing protein [Trichlorobacter sp.]
MHYGKKGFTLVEMIIVMAMFMLVIMAASSSFNVLLTQMTKLTKTEESNIEGVVGLEMLRHDLQQVGFGLPDAYMEAAPPAYGEASIDPADDYNDAPSGLPRAVVAGNDLLAGAEVADAVDGVTYELLAGTDYLALKGTTLGMNETAQKWTYLPFDSGITGLKKPRIWTEAYLNLVKDDRVVVVKKTVVKSRIVNQMIYEPTTPDTYWATFDPVGLAPVFAPTLPEEVYYIYGIGGKDNNTGLSMPFNRSDYFVARPDVSDRMPLYCAPNTGILYKARVTHNETASTGYASGALQPMPLLDCVADMQLVFGWDLTDGMGNQGRDGLIDTWSTPEGVTVAAAGATPPATQAQVQTALANSDPDILLRDSLKVVKVYLLAQVGRRDGNYTFVGSDEAGQPQRIFVGNPLDGFVAHRYDLTAAQRNYRWKVYQLAVRPKNLESNQ